MQPRSFFQHAKLATMVSPMTLLLASFLMALLASQCIIAEHSAQAESSRVYIAFLGERKHDDPRLVQKSHHDMLTSLLGSKEKALSSIIYSYKHGFSGFAATLTESQAKQLSGFPGVISVKPNEKRQLKTTRSWDFLGLPYDHSDGTLLQKANYGEGVIVGVIDTGVWPESRSFRDDGFGPIPSRWKGKCQTGKQFNRSHCNRKLIGSRWYTGGVDRDTLKGEYLSARDLNGHGTHTASTAAGVLVPNASYNGIAAGVARGGAPRARLAVYKACWGAGGACFDAPVLKAIDDAIHDGVDVLSLSLGSLAAEQSGTLFPVSKGITVVFAAGNDGPTPQTVANAVPWVITVAASTMDRSFPTVVNFDDKVKIVGQSMFYDITKSTSKPVIYGGRCNTEDLKGKDVTGNIVFCYSPSDASKILPSEDFIPALRTAVNAGAGGVIYEQYPTDLLYGVSLLCKDIPCVFVDIEAAMKTIDSLTDNTTAKVSLTRTDVGDEVWAPMVAYFSSRGPSHAFPSAIKPDIAAPGANIVAAKGDSYVFDSGTSMACPHISGVAALLKAAHPDWSPAAIKSAMVTTAMTTDRHGQPILANGVPRKVADPFDYGGGFVDPNRAIDPGLVYDINPKDYLKFFNCTLVPDSQCDIGTSPLYYLNLPSIAIPDLRDVQNVWRSVTNVGNADATYTGVVEPPSGIKMAVEPSVLVFNAHKKMNSFKVTFTATRRMQGQYTFGSLTWVDGDKHAVRIPIAVRTIIYDNYADVS